MRDFLEQTFACSFRRYAEFNGESEVFEAVQNGKVLVADSLPLLISAFTAGRFIVLPAQLLLAA